MSKASSRKQFEGRWRITDSSNWSPEDLDLVGAAHILFNEMERASFKWWQSKAPSTTGFHTATENQCWSSRGRALIRAMKLAEEERHALNTAF